jgi:glucose/arabinose dehydrogenase
VSGLLLLAAALAACSGGSGAMPPMSFGGNQPPPAPSGGPVIAPSVQPGGPPSGTPVPTPSAQPSSGPPAPSPSPPVGPTAPPADARLRVPSGFAAAALAHVAGARELAALPNGDLIVGTSGSSLAIVPGADGPGAAGAPATFVTLSEGPAEGVAYGGGFVFAATNHAVWRIPYTSGARGGSAQRIASVRGGPVAPNSDGDVHVSTSVAVSGGTLYVGVGSSCNACAEVDPTRATIQTMGLDGSGMTTRAKRWRNAIALATDPASGAVWAGGAGQDDLAFGHPYEFMDAVSARPAGADYGWPDCEENRVAYTSGANCASQVVPALEFPAYSTIIGAAFYPAAQGGAYAFPAAYAGGMFVSLHGSWHQQGNAPFDPPHVAFVPFSGGAPARAVNWSDPSAQWNDFFTGFQDASGARIGRTTGVAVGPNGSLFVADDQTGAIFRIRPVSGTTGSSVRASGSSAKREH